MITTRDDVCSASLSPRFFGLLSEHPYIFNLPPTLSGGRMCIFVTLVSNPGFRVSANPSCNRSGLCSRIIWFVQLYPELYSLSSYRYMQYLLDAPDGCHFRECAILLRRCGIENRSQGLNAQSRKGVSCSMSDSSGWASGGYSHGWHASAVNTLNRHLIPRLWLVHSERQLSTPKLTPPIRGIYAGGYIRLERWRTHMPAIGART